MKIYCSNVMLTNTDNEYQLIEVNECEHGGEWDGNVVGYIYNALDDPDSYVIIENPDLGNIHHSVMASDNSPKNIVLLADKDGTPLEVYWAK